MADDCQNNNSNAPRTMTKKGRMITLISRDHVHFQISKSAAMHSIFIKDSLGFDDDGNNDSDDDNDNDIDDNDNHDNSTMECSLNSRNVDVLRVSGSCLEKVIEFLNHYSMDPMNEIMKPLDGNTFDEIIRQEWYRTFIQSCLYTTTTTNGNTPTGPQPPEPPPEQQQHCDSNSPQKPHPNDSHDNLNTTSTRIMVGDHKTDATNNTDTNDPFVMETASSTTIHNHCDMNQLISSIASNDDENMNNNDVTMILNNVTTATTTMIDDSTIHSNANNNSHPNRKALFELLAAANYMTIKPLLELICLWVTFQLQGKDVEQVS